MKNLSIIIKVDPRQAVLKGNAIHGEVVHTLTEKDFLCFSQAELDIISKMPMKGGSFDPYSGIMTNSTRTYYPELPFVGDCSYESISTIVNGWEDERKRIIEKDIQESENVTKGWIKDSLSCDDREWLHTSRDGIVTAKYPFMPQLVDQSATSDPQIAARFEEMKQLAVEKTAARAEVEKKNAEARAENKRKEEEEEKVLQEAAVARTAQLAAWVQEKGTENQKKRLARGLLPESEILDGIRNEVFAGLDLPPYEKISNSEVREAYGYEWDDTVVYDTWEVEEMTAEEFDLVEKVEKALKKYDTVVELYAHRGRLKSASDSEDEEYQVIRKSLKVTVTIDQVTVGRRFAV